MKFKIGDRVKCCCDMTRRDCQILDDYVIRVKNISYATSIQFKPNVIWIEWTTNILVTPKVSGLTQNMLSMITSTYVKKN